MPLMHFRKMRERTWEEKERFYREQKLTGENIWTTSQSLVTTATGGRAKTKVVFCRNVIT